MFRKIPLSSIGIWSIYHLPHFGVHSITWETGSRAGSYALPFDHWSQLGPCLNLAVVERSKFRTIGIWIFLRNSHLFGSIFEIRVAVQLPKFGRLFTPLDHYFAS